MRRGAGCVLLAALAGGCGGAREAALRSEAAPIILVSIDTLRSDRLSCYGYAGLETAEIDALAADGVLFERAYSHYPLTLPSHATLFTGLLPPEHGVRNNKGYQLEPDATTLAERLRAAGYRTGSFVSSRVLARRSGIDQGFERHDEPEPPPAEDTRRVFAQRPGEETLGLALDWLAGLRAEERAFLFVHLFEPHTPYDAPEPYAGQALSAYDAEVAHADALVGRFLGELKRRGLYEPALVVLLSDHGEGLGDHVEREHGVFLYREALQVPLILKLPNRQRAGERVATPVGLLDVAPTLLGLVGAEAPELPGRNLLAPAAGAEERVLYAESRFGLEQYGWAELRSAIQGDGHYIRAPKPELYDLARDPRERTNLVGRARVPAALADAVFFFFFFFFFCGAGASGGGAGGGEAGGGAGAVAVVGA